MHVVGERRLSIRPQSPGMSSGDSAHADSRSLEDVLPFAAQAFGRINEATGRNLNELKCHRAQLYCDDVTTYTTYETSVRCKSDAAPIILGTRLGRRSSTQLH